MKEIKVGSSAVGLFGWCTALGFCVLVVGCSGGDVGHVSGRVAVGGKPVTKGAIVFENPQAGISVNAELADDGTYTVRSHQREGLPPGTYQVAVRPTAFGGEEAPLVTDPNAQPSVAKSDIPEKYQSVATSGLTATVKKGDNPPFDFDLKP
ncbi:MAG: carboxypeptidase regulatory-like domain-containing protein [Planctomycetes bacterium]|nr:carboxypeptidase regulatory-like domain-containing protein [Planctomycetota bacterium]